MRTGDGVCDLHSYAQLAARLAQAAFHQITCSEFFANGANVARFA